MEVSIKLSFVNNNQYVQICILLHVCIRKSKLLSIPNSQFFLTSIAQVKKCVISSANLWTLIYIIWLTLIITRWAGRFTPQASVLVHTSTYKSINRINLIFRYMSFPNKQNYRPCKWEMCLYLIVCKKFLNQRSIFVV